MLKNGQIIPSNVHNSPVEEKEKILLRRRQHRFMLFLPVLAVTLISGLLITITLGAAILTPSQIILFGALSLVILTLTTTGITKLIADWYFHFYILTDKRILEISYNPMFSDKINDIILNQVKSTEVDINSVGIINKLLDMGDVTITFDRPTHREEFVFANIKNPKSVGFLVCDALDVTNSQSKEQITWMGYPKKDKNNRYRLIEEIFPEQNLGGG